MTFTIFQDDREKKPFTFSDYSCTVVEQRLKTGDYCLQGDGEMEDDVFYPNYAVERKAQSDFLGSITWERDRFERELARADDFEHRMPIVVEQTLQYFLADNHYRDVHPNSIKATVDAHPQSYNVEYFFNRDREQAADLTYDYMEWRNELLD